MKIQLHNWDAGWDQAGVRVSCTDPAGWMIALRQIRDILLRESDYTCLPDSPLSEADRQGWIEFRQMLRGLPAQVDESQIAQIAEIPDPPANGKPRTWIILDPDWIAERERLTAETEAHASEDHTDADHSH